MQRSFDDLGLPLSETTFVVIDLETTGGSPSSCGITEVGAVKLQGGETLGTFRTLVNPGLAIPSEITYLTGITQAMVLPAPPIGAVIDALASFVGDAVIVGHNVRFDLGFLNAAMDRHGRARFSNPVVDTCALARRLVRDEVPNCRLATLASYLRVGHAPTHRALDDALATAGVLHALLERAGTLGVLGLDDLLALPTAAGHPQLAKLALIGGLPRAPGVYLFRDAGGRVLYVGKATNLRRRVRSYFSSDDRRKVGPLLRELASVDHVVCSGDLEASVLEVRLIHQFMPRYNRRARTWRRYAYLKLTLDERFPRLSVVHAPRGGDSCLYLGPLPSVRAAHQVADAILTVVPLRRCSTRPGRRLRPAPCAPAQLGVATCPCAGGIDIDRYAEFVAQVVVGLTIDPSALLEPLAARMGALAAAGRYEEAADMRNRAAALARAVGRQRRMEALRNAGRLELEVPGDCHAIVAAGVLEAAWPSEACSPAPRLALDQAPTTADEDAPGRPLGRDLADEVATIAAWLEARAPQVRVLACERGLASPLPRLRSFEPLG